MMDALQFPTEVIAKIRWCLWRLEPDKNGRITKIPYRPDGRKAASNSPQTWSTFESVCSVVRQQPGAFAGVGYFLAGDDGICGVDLDACLDLDGQPLPWAAEVIKRFENTYRAFSVSNSGLHIFCHARLPGKGRNFNVPNGPTNSNGKRAQIGVADQRRFFALTGRLYQEAPLEVADHQATIDWLLKIMQAESLPKVPEAKPGIGDLKDAEILERARRAKNGAKFVRLWGGNWEGLYGSQSEADLALCCMLMFWCGPNAARIDSLFRQSGLVREKWLEREDYRSTTINAAIARTSESYRSGDRQSAPPSPPVSSVCERRDCPREIWVGARQLPEITSEALLAVQAANEPPEIFARSGRMVVVVRDERHRHVICELTESGLRGRMARSGFYFKLNKEGERVECSPPLDVVKDLLALSPADGTFRL